MLNAALTQAWPNRAALLWPGLIAAGLRLAMAGAPMTGLPFLLLSLAALALALRRMPAVAAGFGDMLAFALALAAIAAPGAALPWLALPALAWVARREAPVAALLLLVLAAEGLTTGLLGQLLLTPVVEAEARALALLVQLCGLPATAEGAAVLLAEGRAVLLLRGCSAFALLAPTLLAALALPLLVQGDPCPRWRGLGLALLAMLALNMLRLLVMALSPAALEWLHQPDGAALLEVLFVLPPAAALLARPAPCAACR